MEREHLQVISTLYEHGRISRQQMKSIRGIVLSMKTDEQRETYLKKLIYDTRNNKIKTRRYRKRGELFNEE